MTANPFANPAFAAMGEQMLKMWQKAIDSWWSQLLGDSARLSELGQRLAGLGMGAQSAATRELSAELGRVVQALELMDERVRTLEAQVREVAESVAVLVSVMGGAAAAAQTNENPEGDGGQEESQEPGA